LKFRR